VSASRKDDKVSLHINEQVGFSEQKIVSDNAVGASDLHVTDLNSDGHSDILVATNEGLLWYENTSEGFLSSQLVSHKLPISVYASDLDNDKDEDVLGSVIKGEWDVQQVTWYQNTESTLPVELASFDGTAVGGNVQLTWKTASEQNNAGFEVQRKEDSGWDQMGYVESNVEGSTTTETQSYRYTAEDLPVGTHQFRLKQVDLDGSLSIHGQISVDIQMQEALKLTALAPNPVSSTATLSFGVKEKGQATVAVYDMLGRKTAVLFEGSPTSGESTRLRLDASDLPSGLYIIRLRADGKTQAQRMTVVR